MQSVAKLLGYRHHRRLLLLLWLWLSLPSIIVNVCCHCVLYNDILKKSGVCPHK